MREHFLTQSVRSVFRLDLRALALLRIFLSLILLIDLVFRYADLKAFYTAVGVLPVEALFQFHWNPFYFSFLTTSDNYYIQSVLFLLNLMCVLCLLVGYRTKLFTVVVWVFLISIHNRTPLVMQAGDHLLRMLVFWAIFLPWGYVLSMDAYRKSVERKSYSYESFASLAFICQIVFLYYFSALLKSSGEWRSEFTAIYYALSIDQIIRPVGEWLYPHYELLKVMTAGVYYVELFLPLLLLVPFYHVWLRTGVIVGMIMLQLGIFATLNAGLFTATSIVMMVGLLPAPVLDKVWPKVSTSLSQQTESLGRLFFRFRYFRKNKSRPFPKPALASEIIVALSLLYVLGWNMGTVGRKIIPDNLLWIGYLFKLEQHWAMFAPTVFKNDGWFIYQGTTEEGQKIDLLRKGVSVDYNKPPRVANLVKNDRWRKYGENIIMKSNSPVRPYFCNFLLSEWNSANPNQSIQRLKIIYMHEETLPDYRTAEVERWELCECTASP